MTPGLSKGISLNECRLKWMLRLISGRSSLPACNLRMPLVLCCYTENYHQWHRKEFFKILEQFTFHYRSCRKQSFLKVSGAVEALEQIEGIVDENGNRADAEAEAEAETAETEVVE